MLTRNFKQQQLKANRINNKLAYMRLSHYKQQKALQLAKRNLVRLADIRNKSLKQRQAMQRMRQTFDFEEEIAVQAKTRLIRSSRKSRQQALQKWKTVIRQNADHVRVQKSKFHTITNQQKRQQYQSKLKQTQHMKKSLEKSRLSIQQSIQSRIQSTKFKHRQELQNRYRKLYQEKVHNQKLFDVFKAETEKLSTRQSRIRKQVELCKSMWVKINENPENGQIMFSNPSQYLRNDQ